MPTGYTGTAIENHLSFEDFAKLCARNFGFCLTLRDEAFTPNLPTEFVLSESYQKHIDAAQAALQEWELLRPGERAAFVERARTEAIERARKGIERNEAENEYLRGLRAAAEAWIPPVELAGIKTFMFEQIDISLNDSGYWEHTISALQSSTVDELVQREWDSRRHAVESSTRYAREEQARVSERNRCLQGFLASLTATTKGGL